MKDRHRCLRDLGQGVLEELTIAIGGICQYAVARAAVLLSTQSAMRLGRLRCLFLVIEYTIKSLYKHKVRIKCEPYPCRAHWRRITAGVGASPRPNAAQVRSGRGPVKKAWNAPTIKGLTDAVDNRGVRVHDRCVYYTEFHDNRTKYCTPEGCVWIKCVCSVGTEFASC